MNVDDVKDRLALIEAGGKTSTNETVVGITGVKRAYARGPMSLPDSDLPCFVNFAGNTQSVQWLGGFFYLEKRIFKCRLYVTPVQSGISGEAEAMVEPFIDLGMRQFLAHQSLGDGEEADFIPGVQSVTYLGDSGITTMQYAGSPYLGVEFQIVVAAVVEQAPATLE